MKINKKIAFLKENVFRIGGRRVLSAFTLIELIVTVAIIAVLSVVAMVNFSGTRTRARDMRRIQDLQKIASALELIKQVGKTYPPTTSSLVPNYLQILPKDPKAPYPTYAYSRSGGNYKYTLTATLEDAKNNPDNPASLSYTLNSP